MDPKQLFLEHGEAIRPHVCGKCNRIWESRESAERCCRCSYCREYCDWRHGVSHPECQRKRCEQAEAEALDKAVLVPDYSGPFLVDGRVHDDVADLLDYIEPYELPEFGFCTKYQPPFIDISQLAEGVSSDMYEGWEPNGEADLAAAVARWNAANKDNGTYYEDRKRKWCKADVLKNSEIIPAL